MVHLSISCADDDVNGICLVHFKLTAFVFSSGGGGRRRRERGGRRRKRIKDKGERKRREKG